MDYPFTTDGCSGWMTWTWRKVLRRDPPWEGCCEVHDKIYWVGGTAEERFKADCDLALCVSKTSRFCAVLLFLAVRLGGHPLLPLPWRWGYGWKWPNGYKHPERTDV